jgi:lipase ATG15
VNDDKSTVVVTIKGTTPEWAFNGGGPTSKKDKFNDNLLFSCCCARVNFSWKWSEVCDCYKGGSECYQDCVEDALIEESLFYNIGTVSSSSPFPLDWAQSSSESI